MFSEVYQLVYYEHFQSAEDLIHTTCSHSTGPHLTTIFVASDDLASLQHICQLLTADSVIDYDDGSRHYRGYTLKPEPD